MGNKKETVCAVVVTYNRKELLVECLEALRKQTRPLDAIYLIDNASTDNTPELLKEKGYIQELPPKELDKPWEKEFAIKNLTDGQVIKIHYVRMNENTGGAGGFHEGIKLAYEKGHDWIWVMDDDVQPRNNCLEVLLGAANSNRVTAPMRVNKQNGQLEERAAISMEMSSSFFYDTNNNVTVMSKYGVTKKVPDLIPVTSITFEGPLISRTIVEAVGLPRKDMFLLYDDTDYSFRIRLKGFELVLVKAAVLERCLPFVSNLPSWKYYYAVRNKSFMDRKYGTTWGARHIRPNLWFVLRFFKNLLLGRFNRCKMLIQAFVDYRKEDLPLRYPGGRS